MTRRTLSPILCAALATSLLGCGPKEGEAMSEDSKAGSASHLSTDQGAEVPPGASTPKENSDLAAEPVTK